MAAPLLLLLQLQLLLLVVVRAVPQQSGPVLSSAHVQDDDPLGGDPSRAQTCSPAPIEVSMCNNRYYNTTARVIPGFAKQSEVAYVLKQFEELVRAPCAPFMRLFVCSMHLPLCKSLVLVRPCKEFCQRIRDLCSPLMLHFGHAWPHSLSCDGLLPERDQGRGGKAPNICLRPNSDEFDAELERLRGESPPLQRPPQSKPRAPPQPPPPLPPADPMPDSGVVASSPNPTSTGQSQQRWCTAAEVKLGLDPAGSSCAQRCHASFLFSREDKAFASVWMLIWAVICFACSALAVVTFAMDSGRFLFPERPIVWVAACYLVFSLGHILRAALGPEVACSQQLDGPGASPQLYRVSRHAGHWCAVIFLLLYFSSLAGCLWWLVLTVCWYLCAAKKWAHEALAHRTMWLHVFAWGIPLVLSVVLLVLHRIEADELTHLCVVDASSRTNLLVFTIAPTAISLMAGLCFLISALCSTVSVRHSLKWSGNTSFRRLEKLMTKISLFSFMFVLPTACVLAGNAYEFLERDKWTASVEKLLARPHCVNASGLLVSADDGCALDARPSSAFCMLRIFMSLAAGLPSGLVVWFNCKSLGAWRRCLGGAALRRRLQPGAGGPKAEPQQQQLQQQPRSPRGCGAQQQQQQQQQQRQLLLLSSGQSKYPAINGIGTSEI